MTNLPVLELSDFGLKNSGVCPGSREDLRQQVEEGQRSRIRLEMQNQIALLLAADDSVSVVMPAVLETMCEAIGWQWGALWEADADNRTLQLQALWHGNSPRYENFQQLSQTAGFRRGECFPGRVWRDGPQWDPDFISGAYVRAEAAREAGLVSAFGFPISLGGKTLAVVELLSEGVDRPDADLLNTLKAASYGLARHIERSRARESLESSERRYRLMFEANPMPLMIVDHATTRILAVNPEAVRVYGSSEQDLLAKTVEDLYPPGERRMESCTSTSERCSMVTRHARADGTVLDVEISAYGLPWDGRAAWMMLVHDVTERRRMERERESMELQLRSAQRLESIGSLAAGIAHEINTPTQYVGDNVRFLGESMRDLIGIVGQYELLVEAAATDPKYAALVAQVQAERKAVDWDYLRQEIPQAVEQTLAGIQQVSSIVRSMKEFSHPGQQGKTLVDLNRAVENTITISRNEWKYLAELSTELDPNLPRIPCLGGELNQVLLNLIVNAAHAISDANEVLGRTKGHIVVRTQAFPNSVEIQVEDDGGGIPESIRDRIFDPFFTTKGVGRGTGQGLAIARSVVVDKHGGSLCFETWEGRGTTFFVQLPSVAETLLSDQVDLSGAGGRASE